jgi:thiosulfate dehydrogenase [quinone] large subunit
MIAIVQLSAAQQTTLVVLRTLVGWHFLYEGYSKVLFPAWSPVGEPLARWSSAPLSQSGDGTARAALPLDGKCAVD